MDSQDEAARLGDLALFQGVEAEVLARIAGDLHRKKVVAGTQLIAAEMPGESIFFIVSGSVKIQILRADGSEVTLAVLGAGQMVGEMSLIDEAARSADATCLEPTTVLWMDRSTFRRHLFEHPILTENLVRELSHRLRQANQKITALSSLDVAGRLAAQLLAFGEDFGQEIEGEGLLISLPLSQTDLADIVGASRESVNRVLASFRDFGWIAVDSERRIRLLDRKSLAERLE